MTNREFEKIKTDCMQKMKHIDASHTNTEQTTEYNAYNQAIQDVIAILQNNVIEIPPKHTNEYRLEPCIFMTFESYNKLIAEITDGLKYVECSLDGIYYMDTDKAEETKVYFNEHITDALSKYFNVTVTSVHADDSDSIGIWICYR